VPERGRRAGPRRAQAPALDSQSLASSWFAARTNESQTDIAALQQMLDRSYATAGAHLLAIHTPERRLTAQEVVDRLTGMCLLEVYIPRYGPESEQFLDSGPIDAEGMFAFATT
jgi:hypothetical protein